MKKISLLLFALLAISTVSFGQEPTVAVKKETVKIYNPDADARADIDAAVERANKAGKHVFIQVGGNWCPWCIAFHQLVEQNPELKAYLNEHFETVLVNYSKENKNEKVMAALKYPGRFGYPVFVILNAEGAVIHTENSAYLEEGKGHGLKKVMAFLKNWTFAAVDPQTYVKK